MTTDAGAAARIGARERERWAQDGFVVLRGLVAGEELAALRAWVEELAAWPEERGRHWMYFDPTPDGGRLLNRIENFAPFHAGLARLAEGPLAAAVGALLGEPALLFKEKVNFKLPGGAGFEPHQDAQAGWLRYGPLHVTAMLSVDATTVANGCLELAAGQHRRGLVGREWEPMTDEDLAGMVFEPLETEPGDAVFFDSFVPHRSAPNGTDAPRRVLYVTYNGVSAGDRRADYYRDKLASYPPDVEREPGREYRYRV